MNGKRILWALMDTEYSKVSFKFNFHMYTGPEGTIQVIGYTTSNIYEKKVKNGLSDKKVKIEKSL